MNATQIHAEMVVLVQTGLIAILVPVYQDGEEQTAKQVSFDLCLRYYIDLLWLCTFNLVTCQGVRSAFLRAQCLNFATQCARRQSFLKPTTMITCPRETSIDVHVL